MAFLTGQHIKYNASGEYIAYLQIAGGQLTSHYSWVESYTQDGQK